jgi:anti-anti-sigma regulatory factor
MQRRSMLKIQRTANDDVVFTVSGRLEAHNISELSTLLGAEEGGRTHVLDLKDLVLVDGDAVRFLKTCEGNGIVIRNCPPYIRAWMAREGEQP